MKFRSVCLVTLFALLLAIQANAPLAGAASDVPIGSQPDSAQTSTPTATWTGLKAMATGGSHVCVIQADGTVSCWGSNSSGQLGDGTIGNRDLPVKPSSLGAVQDLAAGAVHSCAVTATGAVKCWGDNSEGELGDSTRTTRTSPVQVNGLTSGVKAVAAGSMHSCALLSDNTVKCWGMNDKHQLGDGTNAARQMTPQPVVGLSNVVAITAGAKHTCAITLGGALKCWGANLYGQVGDGNFSDFSSKTPQAVVGLSSGVTDVAAGDAHTCAVVNGSVSCWGKNDQGQLGINNKTDQATPMAVAGIGASRLSAGGSSTCAVKTDNTVACWGRNQEGELGNGSTTDSTTPAPIPGLAGVSETGNGSSFACAIIGGGLKCWGDNSAGQLADGSMILRAVRSDLPGLGGVKQFSLGFAHTCAIKANGEVACWGNNFAGQVGDNSKTQRSTPVVIASVNGSSQVAAGGAHTCALASGLVFCWGRNQEGQLGDGTFTDHLTPAPTNPQLTNVTNLAAGLGHTCAVIAGGVKCWGSGEKGQLGDGTAMTQRVPVTVSGLANVTMVSAGAEHTCALLNDSSVKCWGGNTNGQLGDGTQNQANTPVSVLGLPAAQAITAGGAHTCALLNDGTVRCWGLNERGQLGDGTFVSRSAPVSVSGLPTIGKIAAGGPHTCAVGAADGALYCWGSGGYGELGNWREAMLNTPVAVQGATTGVTALALGQSHTCVELADQVSSCWGWDGSGQLGLGTTTQRLTPTDSQASMAPVLSLDATSGQTGSTFLVTGHRFTPGSTIGFTLNGVPAALTIPTDAAASGSFVVVLDTTGNAPGQYVLRASQSSPAASATVKVRLADNLSPHQIVGGSLTVSVPTAPPLVLNKSVALPVQLR